MDWLRGIAVAMGVCVGMGASSALAADSPFAGRWLWNRAQSAMRPGAPVPKDVVLEISTRDNNRLKWSLTVVGVDGKSRVETLEAATNGEIYRISSDMTASFRLNDGILEVTFRGAVGRSDALTCMLSPDSQRMTCLGVLSGGNGRTVNYVDVYDKI
jgi:hypothetical protein